jgi:hypothetical protein
VPCLALPFPQPRPPSSPPTRLGNGQPKCILQLHIKYVPPRPASSHRIFTTQRRSTRTATTRKPPPGGEYTRAKVPGPTPPGGNPSAVVLAVPALVWSGSLLPPSSFSVGMDECRAHWQDRNGMEVDESDGCCPCFRSRMICLDLVWPGLAWAWAWSGSNPAANRWVGGGEVVVVVVWKKWNGENMKRNGPRSNLAWSES